MQSKLYIFGRTPALSFLELKTFAPDAVFVSEQIAESTSLVPIGSLGGTVKIANRIGIETRIEPAVIAKYIDTSRRTVFGISVYGAPGIGRNFLEEIKALLTGSSARYVLSEDPELSSVVVEKKDVQEIIIVKSGGQFLIGKTAYVQTFEIWNSRDYDRPFSDPKSGMLPPKVARMIVNIAGAGHGKTLVDPFCGMGTVLAEGLLAGWNVFGSDIHPDIVEKARGNLRWLMEHNKLGTTYRLTVSDAVHISEHIDARSVDAVVTEPFMGAAQRALPGGGDVKNTIKGLEKLYIGCLRDWQKILKPHGMVMIALPGYQLSGKTYFVKKVIDMCEKLGYTVKAGPIEYGRPGAIVKRIFYLFQKI